MEELVTLCPQTGFDVAKALPIGDLGKRHAKKLIPTGEALHIGVSLITGDTPPENVHRYEIHDLRKYQLADIHGCSPPGGSQEDARCFFSIQVDNCLSLPFSFAIIIGCAIFGFAIPDSSVFIL